MKRKEVMRIVFDAYPMACVDEFDQLFDTSDNLIPLEPMMTLLGDGLLAFIMMELEECLEEEGEEVEMLHVARHAMQVAQRDIDTVLDKLETVLDDR